MTVAGEPAWVRHAVWWHVYPLGFTGAPLVNDGGAVEHRLRRLEGWLDYAVELGASGLALGPVFESGTHGYDTTDHLRIDRRLGDDGDFDALAKAAHGRGLRLLLDGVFNHVGRDFPHTEWLRRDGADFALFEGHHGLVALDHSSPAVVDHVVRVMRHWLDRGADGWRLDAAYAVPVSFWARVSAEVLRTHPEAYLTGEVIHGDYASFVRDGGLHSVTQYELWKAIWSSLNDGNLFELAWALDRHNGWLDSFVPSTFAGNHDVTRLATRLTDARLAEHALVVLFTVGGTPSVYYGDEQAYRGLKEERAGGDDAIRPAFPAEGPGGLGAEGWPAYRLHQRLIGLRRRHPWLHRARTTVLELKNEQLAYEVVDGNDRLVVGLNLGDEPVSLPSASTVLDGVLDEGKRVPPYGWAITGR